MGLARNLVELEAQIRDRNEINSFAPIKTGGLLETAEFTALISRVGTTDPASIMRLCLQALRIQHDELRSMLLDAELVATLPPETPGVARPTNRVVREMIDSARSEIILLGYEFTEKDLVLPLSTAVSRGVTVYIICDRSRGTADRFLEIWPRSIPAPRVFHDRERINAAHYASMHAKCLLIDGRNLLITSANFTFHGMHGNIEIGIRIAGAIAAEARKVFSYLVQNRVLEEFTVKSQPN